MAGWGGPYSDRVLPFEVLALVFLEGTRFKYGNDFLLNVSHVSRYWRQVALSTPRLWWDVFVSTCWSPRVNYERGAAWMQRSKNGPIRIRSVLAGSWPCRAQDALTPDEVHHAVDLLSSSVCRAIAFILDNRGVSISPQTIHRALRQTSEAIAAKGAPLLRDLSIYGSAPMLREPTAIAGWPAVDLGHLPSIENILLRHAALIERPQRSNLTHNLKRFSYKRYVTFDREAENVSGAKRLSVVDILEIMAECPSLTHLDVSDVTNDPRALSFGGSGRITSASLQSMELSFRSAAAMVNFLMRASFPNVKQLALDADFEATADDARPVLPEGDVVEYPLTHLTSLHLSTVCHIVTDSLLRHAPNLQTLWIDGVDDWPFNTPGPPIDAIIDILVSPTPAAEGNHCPVCAAPSTSSGSSNSHRMHHQSIPCPLIRSICLVDCDELYTSQLMRLVSAYAPGDSESGSESESSSQRAFDTLRVGLRDKPSSSDLDYLRHAVDRLDLNANKWPQSDFDSTPYDFALLSFP